jgi:small subunit ribosomal protein S3
VEIRRKIPTEVWITVQTARPGLLIGRQGKGIESLRRGLEQAVAKQVHINVEEVKDFRLDAQLVAEGVAAQIERRASLNRVIKRAIQEAMKAGAKGIKVKCAGRIGGAEIARSETQKEGKIPLSTLRADVDYGLTEARTAYGHIGVKVWICRDDGTKLPLAVPQPTVREERRAPVAPPAPAVAYSPPAKQEGSPPTVLTPQQPDGLLAPAEVKAGGGADGC